MSKRNHPEHDTPPKDQRNKRNNKGLNADTSPTHCLVCCNVKVEYDEEKGIEGDDVVFCEGSCSAWIYIESVHVSARNHMKHLQSRNRLISVPIVRLSIKLKKLKS